MKTIRIWDDNGSFAEKDRNRILKLDMQIKKTLGKIYSSNKDIALKDLEMMIIQSVTFVGAFVQLDRQNIKCK